jgi:hypothetical protein
LVLRPDRGKSPDFSRYLTRNQQESRVIARQKGDLSARQPAADVCRNTLAGLAEAELDVGGARAVVEMNSGAPGTLPDSARISDTCEIPPDSSPQSPHLVVDSDFHTNA